MLPARYDDDDDLLFNFMDCDSFPHDCISRIVFCVF